MTPPHPPIPRPPNPESTEAWRYESGQATVWENFPQRLPVSRWTPQLIIPPGSVFSFSCRCRQSTVNVRTRHAESGARLAQPGKWLPITTDYDGVTSRE